MNCRVVVEAAVPVYDVETADEAVRIAISKTGEMLNPDLNYVEINMGERTSPSGEKLEPAFIAADEALVALELEMTVFNVERDEHAARIARKEIGQRLENIPLEVLEVEEIPDEDDDADDDDNESATDEDDDADDDDNESATDEDDNADDDDNESATDEDDDADDEDNESQADGNDDTLGDKKVEDAIEEVQQADDPVDPASRSSDDEVLPEFEELIDE